MAKELPMIKVGSEAEAPASAPAQEPTIVIPAEDPFTAAIAKGFDEVDAKRGIDPFGQSIKPKTQEEPKQEKPDEEPGTAKLAEDKKEETEPGKETGSEEKKEASAVPTEEPKEAAESYGAKGFRKLKESQKVAMAGKDDTIAQLQKQVAEAVKTPDTSGEEALKEQLLNMQKQLEQVALERSPRFKDKHNPVIEAASNALKIAAGEQGEELIKLAKMGPGDTRAKLVRDLLIDSDALSLGGIGAALAQFDQATAFRQTELDNHQASIQEHAAAIEVEKGQQAQLDEVNLGFVAGQWDLVGEPEKSSQ